MHLGQARHSILPLLFFLLLSCICTIEQSKGMFQLLCSLFLIVPVDVSFLFSHFWIFNSGGRLPIPAPGLTRRRILRSNSISYIPLGWAEQTKTLNLVGPRARDWN